MQSPRAKSLQSRAKPPRSVANAYALVGDIGRFEIQSVYFDRGLLWVIAVADENTVPTKFAGGRCMVRVYGPDGAVCAIMSEIPIPPWKISGSGATVTIQFPIHLVGSEPGENYIRPRG